MGVAWDKLGVYKPPQNFPGFLIGQGIYRKRHGLFGNAEVAATGDKRGPLEIRWS